MRTPPLAVFLAFPIRIRSATRGTRLDALGLPASLVAALRDAGLRTAGDLAGRAARDLNFTPGVTSGGLRRLYQSLARLDAFEPMTPEQREWATPPAPPAVARRDARRTAAGHLAPRSKVGPGRGLGVFPAPVIRIRPEKRDVAFAGFALSTWLTNTLDTYRIRTFGDLDGRQVSAFAKLRRIGATQLRELVRLLSTEGALIVPPAPTPRARAILPDLWRLLPNPLRRRLLAAAAPYRAIRYARIAIRPDARDVPLDELPMPHPLRKLVSFGRRKTLGDLDGLEYGEVARRSRASPRTVVQLDGLLRLADASAPTPALDIAVPSRLADLPLDDVPMPRRLRTLLRARRIARVGQLASLTPRRLGRGFGPTLLRDLRALAARLSTLHLRREPAALAVDAALARLPAPARRALLLRFGAEDRPRTVDRVARLCGLPRSRDGSAWFDRQLAALAAEMSVDARRRIAALRSPTRRSARMSPEQADRRLGITRSRPLYGRDFYLRIVAALDRRVRIAVPWGKVRSARRPATRRAAG